MEGRNTEIRRTRKQLKPVNTGESSSQNSNASSYRTNTSTARSKGHGMNRATQGTSPTSDSSGMSEDKLYERWKKILEKEARIVKQKREKKEEEILKTMTLIYTNNPKK